MGTLTSIYITRLTSPSQEFLDSTPPTWVNGTGPNHYLSSSEAELGTQQLSSEPAEKVNCVLNGDSVTISATRTLLGSCGWLFDRVDLIGRRRPKTAHGLEKESWKHCQSVLLDFSAALLCSSKPSNHPNEGRKVQDIPAIHKELHLHWTQREGKKEAGK